ncbi:MAG: tryptophan synthase subunit alpha [Chloroflexota bacterium]|nr:tryptophan synthase subunit alpha [Chloroflexota bacterium]
MSVRQLHSVSALPIAPDGRVLLQQRDDKPTIPYPGAWTFFGGAVEGGESYDEAVHREVLEELGIALPLHYWMTYLCAVRSIPGEVEQWVHVYYGDLHQPVESLTLSEGQAMALYDADSASRLTLGFGKSPILARFFAEVPDLVRDATKTARVETQGAIAMHQRETVGLESLHAMFTRAKADGRSAFLPYFPIGYPDYDASLDAIRAMAAAGVDGFEIGIPFSDPLADGPVIQAATQKALENGMTVRRCLEAVRSLREEGIDQPMLMMGYVNPLLAYGVEKFVLDSKAAGADGLIVPDLPPEEAAQLIALCERHDMGLIFFLAPTSSAERIALVAGVARGFIYVVALTGVTGARTQLPPELSQFIARVRASSGDVPLVMGFGISTPEQARQVGALVDGFIVGSALVRAGAQGTEAVAALTRGIREAIAPMG